MRYLYKIYGIWHGANDYLSNDPINFNKQKEFHYLAIDKISAICGNAVTMVNGDYYELDDYNIDKLKEFLYNHEFRFIDTLSHEWRPSSSMMTDC